MDPVLREYKKETDLSFQTPLTLDTLFSAALVTLLPITAYFNYVL
jgi:hypothetical protein